MRTVPSHAEVGVDIFVGLDYIRAMARLDWIGFDVVAIRYIEDDDVTVALIGGDGKSTCLITIEFALNILKCHVHVMSFVV